jgi:ubiquitin-conjugating enzyme E2 Z
MSDPDIKVVTPDTIKRITRDIKNVIKNPLDDNGIYYQHNMDNVLKGYAMIIGPTDTPYQDGFYFFQFDFPCDYPHSPPVLTFLSNGDNIRFNPNLYRNGKVCISILNTWRGEQWTSCQSISTILLTLCTILNENPLLNEPGITSVNPEIIPYNLIISYKNNEVCIINMLKNIKEGKEPFSLFKTECEKHFKENYKRVVKNIENILEQASETTYRNNKGELFTNIYKMAIKVNKTSVSSLKKKMSIQHRNI